MRQSFILQAAFALFICVVAVLPAHAQDTTYRTATTRWRAPDKDFESWQRSGVALPPTDG